MGVMAGSKKVKFSVLEHELVPKHEIVPPSEALRILRELGLKPTELPMIKVTDPVAMELGAKPGDLIRIIRKSPTAGIAVYYRYVVPVITKK